MPALDLSAYAARVVVAVKAYVAKSEAAMGRRIEAIEQQLRDTPLGAPGERGEPGPSGESIKGEAGADGKDGRDGKDAVVDTALLAEMVAAAVRAAVAALPVPKDGKDGAPGTKGDRGEIGASVHPDTVSLMVREAAEKITAVIPKPKDGADGFSLDDFDVSLAEDGRTLTLKFERGDLKRERTIKLETLIYREVWREGEYERGDVVTWGGSIFIAQRKPTGKPGDPDSGWKLAVKHGRDGRDGAAPVPQVKELVRLR